MTDHSANCVIFEMSERERGRGYWKFNSTHLKNPEFLESMNSTIENAIKSSVKMDEIVKSEFLKMQIHQQAKLYAKELAQNKELIISQLSEKLLELENRDLTGEPKMLDVLVNTKADLNEAMLEKAKGLIFRSKCSWQEFEGKSSKYFYSLEKAKYKAKTCYGIYDERGNYITSDYGILDIQEKFYRNLYDKDNDVCFTMADVGQKKVPIELQEAQKTPFSKEEIARAVLQLKNGKCPGIDGINADFYKVFWCKLGDAFFSMLQCAFKQGKFGKSLMRGVINLIPKANKDVRFLKNLRPITLLNVDYKIIEKCIANRLVPALDSIINIDQKGFLANRRISINIRRIFDILVFADEHQVECLIMSLDFEKCFDKIDFSAIYGSMEFFEFAPYLVEWTKILYNGFSVCIQNNGKFSRCLLVKRSVHQGGGPASSFLFLLCAETLAIALRNDKDIQGIPVDDIIHLIGQYADDADIYQLYNEASVQATVDCLNRFQHLTGFTVSYDKTQIFRIGSLKDSQERIVTSRDITWTNGPINVLGVFVDHSVKKTLSLNYEMYVDKTKTNTWKLEQS